MKDNKLYKTVPHEEWQKQYPGKKYHDVYPDEPKEAGVLVLVPVEQEDWIKEKLDRLEYLEGLINNPEIENFLEGVRIEAAHQTERWGAEDEAKKSPAYYSLVFGKLLGKQSMAAFDLKADKYKHHLVTMAAACFNTHRQVDIKGTAMNNWFDIDSK